MPPDPYGLRLPTMTDARDGIHRVHGDDGPRVWAELLQKAGATEDLDRLLPVMTEADPVTRLCAQALTIRRAAHFHLSAAQDLTRS